MSSSTSDIIIGYIAYIQRKNLLTKQRFASMRCYFFQSIGFSIILYCFSQLLLLLYLLLKIFFRIIFQIFSIIFWLPVNTIESFMPKINNYFILFPLFWLCSIVSFSIAKFSHKNVGKRRSFILSFIILLLLQSVFILLPLAISIHEQQKSSSTPIGVQRTVMTLSEIDEMTEQGNKKREEFTSMKNEIKLNKATKNLSQKKIINSENKLSSSFGEDSNVESDVEDEQAEKTPNLPVSSNEEQKLLLKQQANQLVDPPRQFSSKILETSSEFIQEKFNNWLDHVRNIWQQTKLNCQQFFSLTKTHFPQYNVSSIYSAFTDLNCYDYTKFIHRSKENYIYFLNTYRHQSPFPIYLSIIKSNGPQCYPQHSNSSCAIRSKLFFPNIKRQLYRFIRFWMIISIPMIIFIFIYKRFRYRQSSNRSSNTTNDLPSQPIPSNIDNNDSPLDEKIENGFRLWLEQEQNDGYKNISESCRMAFNETISKRSRFFSRKERVNIETLQFSDAKIHDVSQRSIEPIVINAILDIDYLIFNAIKDQHFSIQIPKLTGELEIHLINNTIEIKFKQIQIDNAEIIDPENIFSSDEKEVIIKLFKEVMNETIVQCGFYLSDNQEKAPPPVVPPSPEVTEQCEAPIITPITETHPLITDTHPLIMIPEREVKKLLVRIVKAVKLHDVEQPFCILELNQPKQIHQTTFAKNGLNPFWDERFLFECNDKSNQLRLQIFDHKKPNHKKINQPTFIDTIYADVSIPFAYVTSTIYKQDVRITPQYPDSIIRIEFSTLTEEEALIANHGYDIESTTNSPSSSYAEHEANKIAHDYRASPVDEILTLTYHADGSAKDYNHIGNYPSSRSQLRTTDAFSTLSPMSSPDDDIRFNKPRKSRSFMGSFRLCSRQKKYEKKNNQNENGVISSLNTPTQTNSISPSLSTEPVLSPNPTPIRRRRSFRNFFRPNSKKKTLNTDNFIIDHPDLISTSTPTPKKRSFFRRFRSKQKQPIDLSMNSLTSDDCTRCESARNTPVRANVGRPVTMTNSFV